MGVNSYVYAFHGFLVTPAMLQIFYDLLDERWQASDENDWECFLGNEVDGSALGAAYPRLYYFVQIRDGDSNLFVMTGKSAEVGDHVGDIVQMTPPTPDQSASVAKLITNLALVDCSSKSPLSSPIQNSFENDSVHSPFLRLTTQNRF